MVAQKPALVQLAVKPWVPQDTSPKVQTGFVPAGTRAGVPEQQSPGAAPLCPTEELIFRLAAELESPNRACSTQQPSPLATRNQPTASRNGQSVEFFPFF